MPSYHPYKVYFVESDCCAELRFMDIEEALDHGRQFDFEFAVMDDENRIFASWSPTGGTRRTCFCDIAPDFSPQHAWKVLQEIRRHFQD